MDLFSCPICFDQLTDPKIIPGCGHTLCGPCVQRLCPPAARAAACPTCRAAFRPCDVRTNFTVQALLQEYDASGGSFAQPSDRQSMLPGGNLARSGAGAGVQQGRRKQLEFLGVPSRLAAVVAEEDGRVGRRVFLLDNSGSTAALDGKALEQRPDGGLALRACSRWEEIKRLALDHAAWNAKLGTPCEFLVLNPKHRPSQEGVDFVHIDAHHTAAEVQIARLRRMLDDVRPGGGTPLGERVREIGKRVAAQSAALQAQGQSVILVLATDGLPTMAGARLDHAPRQDLVAALRHVMTTLPVTVVIRLCTDDGAVADFYSDIEKELELPLDVLDDAEGEAREIARVGNGWFTYTPELHRIREGGTFVKLLDLLDERRLSAVEASVLAQLLLREEGEPPLPRDPEAFCDEAERLAEEAELVPCARRRFRKEPPVDAQRLRVAVLGLLGAWMPSLAALWRPVAASCMPEGRPAVELPAL